jgi:hypothetical protein
MTNKKPVNLTNVINEIYSFRTPLKFVSLDVSQVNNDIIYEGDWLTELFGRQFSIEVVTRNTILNYENLVIVLIRGKWKEQIEWLDTICKSGIQFKILHFSDEFEQDPIFFYDRPQIKGVLRFYLRSDIVSKKVLSIPLGYHWINKEQKVPFEERKYKWSFCGTNWQNRSDELAPLLQIQPYKAEFYPEWNHSSQLSKEDYITLLLNTQFVPCPRGNNVETFRFYEALEHGCIPVFTELPPILRNSDIPFIKTETWSDVLSLIKDLSENPIKLKEYKGLIGKAWVSYKNTLRQQIKEWEFM